MALSGGGLSQMRELFISTYFVYSLLNIKYPLIALFSISTLEIDDLLLVCCDGSSSGTIWVGNLKTQFFFVYMLHLSLICKLHLFGSCWISVVVQSWFISQCKNSWEEKPKSVLLFQVILYNNLSATMWILRYRSSSAWFLLWTVTCFSVFAGCVSHRWTNNGLWPE